MNTDADSDVDRAGATHVATAAADCPLELEAFFDLVADERTRYLCYLLAERGGTVPLEELEAQFDDEHAAVRLHHDTLPRLADRGLVEFDHETGVVTPTRLCDDLRPALESVRAMEGDAADEFLSRARR